MCVLPYQQILEKCGLQPLDAETKEAKTGAIRPCLKSNVRSAGYDLRLGNEYYMKTSSWGRQIRIQKLDRNSARTLTVPPNQVVIVTTMETLSLPPDVVGHLTLKLDLLLQGLIMANQSQVDAGYEGGLFILLYNLSNHDVSLQLGQSVLRLELDQLTSPTSKPYSAYGGFSKKSLAEVVARPVESSLEAMRGEVEKSNKKIVRTQLLGGIILILTSVFTYFGPLAAKTTKFEEQIATLQKAQEAAQGEEIKSLKKSIDDLNQKLEELKKVGRVGK
jgi:deoxycytidine triphosphate deaminase